MILFIWHSIHKPHVEREIIVKSNFMFEGIFIRDKLFNDVVISNILNIALFIY